MDYFQTTVTTCIENNYNLNFMASARIAGLLSRPILSRRFSPGHTEGVAKLSLSKITTESSEYSDLTNNYD